MEEGNIMFSLAILSRGSVLGFPKLHLVHE